MRLFSVRRNVLGLVARVLERWLQVVNTRLEPDAERPPVGADPRQPQPPEHWLELVRQHAPQLLEADQVSQADSSVVIDWRADDTPSAAPVFEPPTVRPRPLPLRQAQPLQLPVAPRREPLPKRPLRLQQVSTRALDTDDVRVTLTDVGAEAVPPEFVRTTARPVTTTLPIYPTDAPRQTVSGIGGEQYTDFAADALTPPLVSTALPAAESVPRPKPRRFRLPLPNLSIRRGKPAQDVGAVSVRFPDAPSLPPDVRAMPPLTSYRAEPSSLPTVPTQAGGSLRVSQHPTGVPGVPPQLVLHPTQTHPALKLEDITADRWASLPEAPADEPRVSADERYHRLRREQEGRAWNE